MRLPAGGCTFLRTHAALPGQVRLRISSELQRHIHAWAAQPGLGVQSVPASGAALTAEQGGRADRCGLLSFACVCLKRMHGRIAYPCLRSGWVHAGWWTLTVVCFASALAVSARVAKFGVMPQR